MLSISQNLLSIRKYIEYCDFLNRYSLMSLLYTNGKIASRLGSREAFRIMKALYVQAPENYKIIDVPVPTIKDEEVLIQVGFAAICHSDLDAIHGYRKHLIRFPFIGGHEFAGTVVEVGEKVPGFREGDKVAIECIVRCRQCRGCDMDLVYCENYSELGFISNGGFAEYVAVPARNCHKIINMSMEQAALV